MDRARDAPLAGLARDLMVAVLAGVVVYGGFLLLGIELPRAISPGLWTALDLGALLLVGWLLARAFGRAIRSFLTRAGNLRSAAAIRLVVDILIAAGAVAVLLHLLGVSVESIFFGSAFAGIVLGLAAQTVFANVFAGLLIVFVTPFQVGERISIVSQSYGAIWPSYPHELMYPTYTGTVTDVGLFYTVLQADSGEPVKIPNATLLGSLVVNQIESRPHEVRVRMTFPLSTPARLLDEAVGEYAAAHAPPEGHPAPTAEVADIGATTWDGTVVLWTREPRAARVRDEVLRTVLPRVAELAGGGAATAAARPRAKS